MSVVVDASTLVAALIDTGPEGKWAEALIQQGDIHAPELAMAESTNVLRRSELAGTITGATADAAHRDLMRLAIVLYGFGPFANRIWALRGNLTAYDAWQVAIAEASGLPLATLDRRLARTTGVRCRFMTP